MRTYRFFIEEEPNERAIIKDKKNLHYIHKVLRLKKNKIVYLVDGKGGQYEGRIEKIEPSGISFRIIKKERLPLPQVEITLLQGIPQHPKMDIVMEIAASFGVKRIVPLITERTIVKKGNIERWRNIVKASFLTSRQGVMTEVSTPMRIDEVHLDQELVLIAWEEEKKTTIKDIISSHHAKTIAVFIGPEGGFTKEEVELIQERGGISVSLGRQILKTEYAGFFVLSAIFYEFDLL